MKADLINILGMSETCGQDVGVWMSKNIETTDTFLYLKIPKKIYEGRA